MPLLALAHVAVVTIARDPRGAARPVKAVPAMMTHVVPVPSLPAIEPPLVEVTVSAEVAPPQIEIAAVAGEEGANSCVLADSIRAALISNPGTPRALAAIPVGARTVANAVMMWDGHWTSLPPQAGGSGLKQLRAIIVASIRAAPADCRAAAVGGPRLIFVPEGATTVVLAFGSGTWTWAELLG